VVVVQFPKLDVNHIEILIAEKLPIFVDFRLIFDIKQTLQNVRLLELPS
jgi:hypothetical protein